LELVAQHKQWLRSGEILRRWLALPQIDWQWASFGDRSVLGCIILSYCKALLFLGNRNGLLLRMQKLTLCRTSGL
jgi:hypothetical protein